MPCALFKILMAKSKIADGERGEGRGNLDGLLPHHCVPFDMLCSEPCSGGSKRWPHPFPPRLLPTLLCCYTALAVVRWLRRTEARGEERSKREFSSRLIPITVYLPQPGLVPSCRLLMPRLTYHVRPQKRTNLTQSLRKVQRGLPTHYATPDPSPAPSPPCPVPRIESNACNSHF